MHRGVIETPVLDAASILALPETLFRVVRAEFRPNWFRGFAFGAITHCHDPPRDVDQIHRLTDHWSFAGLAWQWIVCCFHDSRQAAGIHEPRTKYLHPVYRSIVSQLETKGCQCKSKDLPPFRPRIAAILSGILRIVTWTEPLTLILNEAQRGNEKRPRERQRRP